MAQKMLMKKTITQKTRSFKQLAAFIVACVVVVCSLLLVGFQASQALIASQNAGAADANSAGNSLSATESTASVNSVSGANSANGVNDTASTYTADNAAATTGGTTATTSTSDWLSDIRDDTTLSTLTLPGTHDSATYNFVKDYTTKSYAQCQDMSFENQLAAGIRVFDLRYVYNHDSDGQFTIWHGYGNDYGLLNFDYQCADSDGSAATLPKILAKFKTFLAAHPTEIVVVNFQKEGGTAPGTKLTELRDQYGVVSASSSSTLGSLRGKIVDRSNFLQNITGDYNDWETTESNKIQQMKNCFAAAPDVAKSYSGSVTQRCICTNLAFNAGDSVNSVKSHAEAIRSGFFDSNPFSTYGQKAYGMILYDFPTTNVINMTIAANSWAGWNYYTVKFDTKSSSTISSQTVREKLTATKPETDPVFTGMTFEGWYADTDCNTQWNFDTDVITADTTIYAKWSGKITYMLDGGTNASDNPSSYIYGKGVSSFSAASKNQAIFGGWYTDSNFSTKATSISATQSGEVILYAKWDPCHEMADTQISVPSVTYNAQAQTPAVTVVYNSETVSEENYTVSYSSNINAGVATVTITGKKDFIGTTTVTFTINPAQISSASFDEIASQTYTGLALQPAISGSFNSQALTSNDFDVSYSENINAGNGKASVSGKNNFTGKQELNFSITAAPISTVSISGLDETFRENGTGVEPTLVLTNPNTGKALEKTSDYTLSFTNNKAPGKASVTITGKGNWSSSRTENFTILGDLSKASVSSVSAQGKSPKGDPITPQPIVTGASGLILVLNTDYTLNYENNTNIGTATINIIGAGVYAGTQTSITFEIKASFNEVTISGIEETYDETGAEIRPIITATDQSGAVLSINTDYTVSYANNTTPGKASVTIAGQGSWAGSQVKNFIICGDIEQAIISELQDSYLETNSYIIPDLVITNKFGTVTLTKDTDYELALSDNKLPGTASYTIKAKGNYWKGTQSGTFTIKGDMTKARVTGVEASYEQTGSAIEPLDTGKAHVFGISSSTVELVRNTDYTVSYANNINLGIATITLTGIGKYEGTKQEVQFKIYGDIRKGTATGIEKSYVETGSALTPKPSVSDVAGELLDENEDYTLAYKDNIAPGYGIITVTGAGNYEGVITLSFKITGDISAASVSGVEKSYKETGSAIKPDNLSVVGLSGNELTQGSDYKLSYENNTAPGTASVIITGIGNNYKDTQQSVEFLIAGDISKASVSGVEKSYKETGSAVEPANLSVVGLSGANLVQDSDYTLSYENNILPGTASIILTGIGSYEGSEQKLSFSIVGDISTATISGIEEQYEQTGKAITPEPVVTSAIGQKQLVKDTDYTLNYTNNTEVGTATITINGIGNWINFAKVNFAIVAKTPDPEPDPEPDPDPDPEPEPEPDPDPEPETTTWQRLAGGTALGTMKKIVEAGWESSEWAIVATSASYQDALSASALAGVLGNAPVLMTKSDELSSQAKTLLQEKNVKKVVIVGGTSAVSAMVEIAIKNLDIEVSRAAGASAAGTAVQVYEFGVTHGGWGTDAIVATTDSFQDALSIAPYAYAKHAPIFLTDKGTKDIRSKVVSSIANGGFMRTIIVGGEAAVSKDVEEKVVSSKRLQGGTAYGTSAKIANFCLDEGGMSAVHMGVACGTTYQDALVGASFLGKNSSIIVLADDKNSKNVNNVIAKQSKTLDTCYIFGGKSAVSDMVEIAIKNAS